MKLAYACILVAALQPYLWSVLSRLGAVRSGLRLNNHQLRAQLDQYHGWSLRAHWANSTPGRLSRRLRRRCSWRCKPA